MRTEYAKKKQLERERKRKLRDYYEKGIRERRIAERKKKFLDNHYAAVLIRGII